MSWFIGVFLYLFMSVRISITDFQTHFIKNIDLIFLLLSTLLVFHVNLYFALINFLLYLVIYFLSRRKLGFGDVKLSIIVGLTFASFYGIFLAINIAWFLGGCWAVLSRQRKVAFAPWMLIGGMLAQIMVN